MYLSELVNKEAKEIKTMSKADLIDCITKSKWQFESRDREIKESAAKLRQQSENERAMKIMLIGYLKYPVERSEYTGEIELDKINLSELFGLFLCEVSKR